MEKLWRTRENIEILNLLQQKEEKRSYLVSEPNYHAINFFTENLLATDMGKIERPMNKPIYLGLQY